MARLFIDGFESGTADLFTATGNLKIVTASTYGMTGNYALSVPLAAQAFKYLETTKSELYVAFKWRTDSLSDGQRIIEFWDTTPTLMLKVYPYNTSGSIGIMRGTTLLDNSDDGVISANTTYLIEVYYKPLNTGGICTVKVNGIEVASASGVDTTDGAEAINMIGFYPYAYTCYYDDIVIDDADWIGQTYIEGIVPSGAGTTTQWDPSTGSNYACVDELPASDTDYISTNTTNEIDTYAMGNLTSEIGTIKCIQVRARSLYEGAPTPTHQQLVVRSGGTDYFSADKDVGTTAAGIFHIWETNPADDAAWEEADVNAIEAGVKATA